MVNVMIYQEIANYQHLSPEERTQPYRAPGPGVWGWIGGGVFFVMLAAGAGVLLEFYGITNAVSGFGKGGRPAVELGIWHLRDVSDSLVAAPYINELVEQGVISGYLDDEFKPQRPITRAEFAALVNQAFVQQTAAVPQAFEDVPENFWGQGAIANVSQDGFFVGYGDGTFRPQQPITYQEALFALQQGLNLENTREILRGQPQLSQADPDQPLTRAEAAILIYQTQNSLHESAENP
jgi:hypothetical protein